MNSFSFYDLNEEGHQEGLLTQSKHIKKVDKTFQKQNMFDDEKCNITTKQSPNGRKGATYDTFNSEERDEIYEILKTGCQDSLNDIMTYKAPQYRELLKTIIPKFRADFNSADKTQMTQMWKKVKGIIASKTNNKSEKRGEPIILDNELPEFRLRIKAIIKTLKTKDFEAFRKKLLPVIQEIRTKGGRAFDPNVFKKHKWSEFVNDEANSDIKRLWKSLKRSSSKNSCEDDEETVTSCHESRETMASEADYEENMNASPLTSSVESTQAVEGNSEPEYSHDDDFGCVIEIPDFSSFVESVQNYQGVDTYFAFEDSVDQQFFMETPQTPSFGGLAMEMNNCMGSYGAQEKFIREAEEDGYQKEFFAGLSTGKFSWEHMF